MNAFGKFVSGISSLFEFNKATLSGALDVIVVENEEGVMVSSPFRVRFGKLKVLKSHSKEITITVNNSPTSIAMKLSSAGEGYFAYQSDSSPLLEEKKSVSENSSPECPDSPNDNYLRDYLEIARNKPEPILPKKGDSCDDLIAGDEEGEDEEMTVEMSLCADIWDTNADKEQVFTSKLVRFEDFQKSPWEIIQNPNLLIKLDNKVYTKEAALPIILSLIVFKQPLHSQRPEKNTAHNVRRPLKSSCFNLSSSQLQSLHLKYGRNDIVYAVESPLQGVQRLGGRIYLWRSDSKIVISDIDGTITKSDVLGHVFTMLGKDWNHNGVAKLYDLIHKNGYKFMYLSSRPIGHASLTREFLFSLKQDGIELPDGPLIVSPDRFFQSMMREVVHKTPQKFKTAALNEVSQLFLNNTGPFYAGFGNRDTDAIAYRASGVALDKIFIINPQGNIFVFNQNVYLDSYPQMTELINDIFPPINH